jgi:hypothetical protein
MSTDYRSFMDFCKSLKGRTLPAANQTSFILLTVKPNSLEYFLPASLVRFNLQAKHVKQILQRYEDTGSVRISHFADLVHASYTLTLLELYLKQVQSQVYIKNN